MVKYLWTNPTRRRLRKIKKIKLDNVHLEDYGSFKVLGSDEANVLVFEVGLGGERSLRFKFEPDNKNLTMSVFDAVGEWNISDEMDSIRLLMLSNAIELIAQTIDVIED